MLIFINSIDNLLSEIINNKKFLIIIYSDSCHNSQKLLKIITDNDIDLDTKIILVDKYAFLQKNYNKLLKIYFTNYIHNNLSGHQNIDYQKLVDSLSFLTYDSLVDIETPHILFATNNNNMVKIVYKSTYLVQFDFSNSFMKILNNFNNLGLSTNFTNDIINKKIINNFIMEKSDIEVNLDDIKKIKIFI